MKEIKWVVNEMPKTEDFQLKIMALEQIEKAREFHESFPQYFRTPLVKLTHMASFLGVKELYIKDESYRFGSNTFKILGESFSMANYTAKQTNKDISELPYNALVSESLGKGSGQAAFISAIGPNNIKAVELMGYEEFPAWVMQGYGTMAMEAAEQLWELGCEAPTHIFIQAGAGSLAGAITGYFLNHYLINPPTVVVVESDTAAFLYKAALACNEPDTISWDILKNHVSVFAACPDCVAAKGMSMLSAPLEGDPQIISGEAGAVTMGLLAYIMQMNELKELKDYLKLDSNSKILLFCTEGDTNPEFLKEILWEGKAF